MPETKSKKWLTVNDILDELDIPRRTWQRWRVTGRAPKCKRLPNGELRIAQEDYKNWLASLDDEGQGVA